MYVHVPTEKSFNTWCLRQYVSDDSTRLLVEKNIATGMYEPSRWLRRAVYPRAVRTFNFLSPTTFLSLPIRWRRQFLLSIFMSSYILSLPIRLTRQFLVSGVPCTVNESNPSLFLFLDDASISIGRAPEVIDRGILTSLQSLSPCASATSDACYRVPTDLCCRVSTIILATSSAYFVIAIGVWSWRSD
jgi:hypothetical protein